MATNVSLSENDDVTQETVIMLYEILLRHAIQCGLIKEKLVAISDLCAAGKRQKADYLETLPQIHLLADDILKILSGSSTGRRYFAER